MLSCRISASACAELILKSHPPCRFALAADCQEIFLSHLGAADLQAVEACASQSLRGNTVQRSTLHTSHDFLHSLDCLVTQQLKIAYQMH